MSRGNGFHATPRKGNGAPKQQQENTERRPHDSADDLKNGNGDTNEVARIALKMVRMGSTAAMVSALGEITVNIVVGLIFNIRPDPVYILRAGAASGFFAGLGGAISVKWDLKAETWLYAHRKIPASAWLYRFRWFQRMFPKQEKPPEWFKKCYDILTDIVASASSWISKGKPLKWYYLFLDVVAGWLGQQVVSMAGLTKDRAKAWRKGLTTINFFTAIGHKLITRGSAGGWYNYSKTHQNEIIAIVFTAIVLLGLVYGAAYYWNKRRRKAG